MWSNVFIALASIVQLHHLDLCGLMKETPRRQRLVFKGLTNGSTLRDGKMIEYWGETQIAAGLNELIVADLPWENDYTLDTFGCGIATTTRECRFCGEDTE
jgi:hypothetical protein